MLHTILIGVAIVLLARASATPAKPDPDKNLRALEHEHRATTYGEPTP